MKKIKQGFNTQPPEGGCLLKSPHRLALQVSTHSRAKAAAFGMVGIHLDTGVSTHSHPKVAAYYRHIFLLQDLVFQHTATRRWLPSRQTQIKTR